MDNVRGKWGQKVVELPSVAGRVPPHDLDAEAAVLSAVMIDPARARQGPRVPQARALLLGGAPPHLRGVHGAEAGRQAGRRRAGRHVAAGPRAHRAGRRHGLPHRGPQRRAGRRERGGLRAHDPREVRASGSSSRPASASPPRATSTTARRRQFIDGAEQAIYEIARTPESSQRRAPARRHAAAFEQLRRPPSRGDRITGMPDRLRALRRADRRPPRRRPHDRRGAPRHGQDELRPQRGRQRGAAPRPASPANDPNAALGGPGPRRRRLLARDAPRAARQPHALLGGARRRRQASARATSASRTGASSRRRRRVLSSSPSGSTTRRRSRILELRAKVRRLQAEYDRPRRRRASRASGIGLVIVDYLQLMKGRDGVELARAGDQRDLPRPEGARQGAEAPGHRARPSSIARSRRAARRASARSSRTCASRAPSSRTPTTSASSTATTITTRRHDRAATSRSSSSPSSETAPRARCRCASTREYTRFDNLPDGEYAETTDGWLARRGAAPPLPRDCCRRRARCRPSCPRPCVALRDAPRPHRGRRRRASARRRRPRPSALAAAQRGRRVLCLTIDPAKRLAAEPRPRADDHARPCRSTRRGSRPSALRARRDR